MWTFEESLLDKGRSYRSRTNQNSVDRCKVVRSYHGMVGEESNQGWGQVEERGSFLHKKLKKAQNVINKSTRICWSSSNCYKP